MINKVKEMYLKESLLFETNYVKKEIKWNRIIQNETESFA